MAQVNAQLEEMIQKLEGKMKKEVQQRIENQKTLTQLVHEKGAQVQTDFLSKFNNEFQQLDESVSKLERGLKEWEPSILQALSSIRAAQQCDSDQLDNSITAVSSGIQAQHHVVEQMEERVRERMREFLEVKVKRGTMNRWEERREKEEGEMLTMILEFNGKVKEEQDKLEELAKAELKGVAMEIQNEEKERARKDKELFEEANEFLTSIQS